MRRAASLLPRLPWTLLVLAALTWAAGPVLAEEPPAHGEEPAVETSSDAHAPAEGGHASSDHGEAHAADHGDGHGEAHGEHLELPHFLMLLRALGVYEKESPLGEFLHVFENAVFALLAGLLLSILAQVVYRRRSELPGRLQAFFEMIVEYIESLTVTMMGAQYGRHYTPFVATIFVYILAMNYSALIPLGKAPTATFLNNFSIAVVVFLYVQYTGIKRNGLGGYLHHLAGSPKDVVGWCLSPLLFVLELFGEFVKPVSLSLRLFGNIFGEDMLLAVFALLGVVAVSGLGSPVGIPFHLPFLFLSLLLGLIQALVFSLLTTVYLALMLPHDHGEHAEAH